MVLPYQRSTSVNLVEVPGRKVTIIVFTLRRAETALVLRRFSGYIPEFRPEEQQTKDGFKSYDERCYPRTESLSTSDADNSRIHPPMGHGAA